MPAKQTADTRRILPHTPWSSRSLWSVRALPLSALCVSLSLFGLGEALLIKSVLGSSPWTVLAQGLALQTGLNIGWITFLLSCAVMAAWIPLRQKPGLGTVLNILIIALTLGIFDALIPAANTPALKILAAVGGVLTVGCASALYLTAHMGAGPRDGLMVGLCRVSGRRVGVIRSLLEGTVCLSGWLLGGTVGPATLMFAFGVGWVLQYALDGLHRLYPPQHTTNTQEHQ